MEKKTATGSGTSVGEETVLVYSHGSSRLEYTKAALSILVKTESGEVYGGGVCCTEGGSKLNSYTKVEGVYSNIKKIVVGKEHCAALTHAGRLMVWRHTVDSTSAKGINLITLIKYKSGETCWSCDDDCTDMYGLAYCDSCGMYQPIENVNDSVSVLVSQKGYRLLCSKCCATSTPKTIKTWDIAKDSSMNVTVAFCASCDNFCIYQPYSTIRLIMRLNSENNAVRTIHRENDERIKDVAFLEGGICLLSENNKLYVCQPESKNEDLIISYSREMVAVYGKGRKMFGKYEDGSLSKSSNTYAMNNSQNWRDVNLPASVEKLCCGISSTAALLSDGSVWFIGPHCKTYRLVHKTGLDVFTDIAVIAFTDVYLVQAPSGLIENEPGVNLSFYSQNDDVRVEFYESALNTVLKEMVPPTPRSEDSSNVTATTLSIPKMPPPTPNMAQLYGNSFLADMTIKLADEELPAHSSILFATSSHFQKTFNADNPPPKVLDVSHYNPQAFKYLLQYYYQTKPDDLDAEGFTHLRQLAASYEETSLADAATAKIKSQLCEDNVERIFTLSKRFEFQDLVTECERVMRSPPFLEKLLQAAMKNL